MMEFISCRHDRRGQGSRQPSPSSRGATPHSEDHVAAECRFWVRNAPNGLRLPAAKSTAEQMVKIVPAADPGHPEEAVPCGASLILRGLRGFFVAGCDRLLTGEACQTR
jgi:hypothetical protein